MNLKKQASLSVGKYYEEILFKWETFPDEGIQISHPIVLETNSFALNLRNSS